MRVERSSTAVKVKDYEMTRILIVEDEPNMVAGLRDNFEFEGYDVITAPDDGAPFSRRSP